MQREKVNIAVEPDTRERLNFLRSLPGRGRAQMDEVAFLVREALEAEGYNPDTLKRRPRRKGNAA